MDLKPLEKQIGARITRSGDRLVVRTSAGEARGLVERVESSSPLELERAMAHVLLKSDEREFAFLHALLVSVGAEETLQSFVEEVAPGRGWGFIDDAGNARLEVPSHDIDARIKNVAVAAGAGRLETTGQVPQVRTTHNRSLFTDLNQWLLKVMIMNAAPERYWKQPRLSLKGPSDLSREAWVDVSQPKAYQFARTLRDMGYLVWRRGTFHLVDVDRLLASWLEVARTERPYRVAMRSAVGDEIRSIVSSWPEDVYALGGVLAAESYGMRHVSGGLDEVYVFGDEEPLAEQFFLEECEPGRAEFYFVRPLHRNAVSRGIQTLEGGEQVVDLVQVALDASRSSARGREQAEFVIEEILRWWR